MTLFHRALQLGKGNSSIYLLLPLRVTFYQRIYADSRCRKFMTLFCFGLEQKTKSKCFIPITCFYCRKFPISKLSSQKLQN
jgi:hypothetical protein